MIFETLKLAQKNVENAIKVAQETSKVAFAEGTKELFDKHPALKSFAWHQYTPYFNDGDECTFSVYCDYPLINNIDFDELETYDNTSKKYVAAHTDNDPDGKLFEAGVAVKEFISLFNDEDLKFIFGDHCEITIYRDGKIEVDDYNHD